MTHVELLEKMENIYKEEFKLEPANSKEMQAFRDGFLFSLKLVQNVLKDPVSIEMWKRM